MSVIWKQDVFALFVYRTQNTQMFETKIELFWNLKYVYSTLHIPLWLYELTVYNAQIYYRHFLHQSLNFDSSFETKFVVFLSK